MTFYYDPGARVLYGSVPTTYRTASFEGPEELLELEYPWYEAPMWSREETEIENRMLALLPPGPALVIRTERAKHYWSDRR